MDTKKHQLENLIDDARSYLEAREKLARLQMTEKATHMAANLMSWLIIVPVFLIAFLFVSVGLAHVMAEWWGHEYAGYLSVTQNPESLYGVNFQDFKNESRTDCRTENGLNLPSNVASAGSVSQVALPESHKFGRSKESIMKELKNELPTIKDYKNVSLYISETDCFVQYHFRIPGTNKFKRFKERLDILKMFRAHGKTIGNEYANEALLTWKGLLKSGYNPYKVTKKNYAAPLHILEVLNRIKEKMNEGATLSKVRSYLEAYNRLASWITESGLSGMYMAEFLLNHAESYRDWMQKEKKLSPKTINGSLASASTFWKNGIIMGAAYTDIFELIKRVSKKESNGKKEVFEPFTANEMKAIFQFLKESNQVSFMRFVSFIYYSWARPVEITRLLVKDIDLKENIIKFKKDQTKNGKASMVQIVPPLRKILLEMDLDKCNPDWYLFSKDNDYMPGKLQINKNKPSVRWSYWVKAKLGIEKEMYGMKHTGNIDYLLRNKGNINLKWQQMQNRHSSSAMTERYVRKLGAFFIEVGELNFNEYL